MSYQRLASARPLYLDGVLLHLSWLQILLRLVLTLIAGALIGMNREENGRPAGFRTTILVCLAASIAMLQANLLMNSTGKASDSFVVLDLMRFPLGILSGIGFIGAGAILRRPDGVRGVTTAATLWFTTVMGLCFGGGQLSLGCAALLLSFGTLWGLKKVERYFHSERHAELILDIEGNQFSDPEIRTLLRAAGIQITSCSIITQPAEIKMEIRYEVRWRNQSKEPAIPSIYTSLSQRADIFKKVEWRQL